MGSGHERNWPELTHRHVAVLQHVQGVAALEQFLAHAVLYGEGASCHADRVKSAEIFDLDVERECVGAGSARHHQSGFHDLSQVSVQRQGLRPRLSAGTGVR